MMITIYVDCRKCLNEMPCDLSVEF